MAGHVEAAFLPLFYLGIFIGDNKIAVEQYVKFTASSYHRLLKKNSLSLEPSSEVCYNNNN